MTEYLTVDVGGTDIKYGVMTANGHLKESKKQSTPDNLAEFTQLIQSLIDQYYEQVCGYAFSVPGKIDTKTETIYFGGALTYLDGFCVESELETYGKRISVQNDGKAAALAELWLGNLKGIDNGVAMILGTGVGGGIILDGQLRIGPHFQAGEFSFMSSDYSADDYSCAGFTSSAVGMVERINTMLGNDNITDGKAAFEAIHGGNKQAISIFEDYCYVIANQILSIQGILDVKRFVIGGGISAQKILVEEINRQFNTIIKSNPILEVNIPKDIEIMATKFGNDANLYGALYNFLQKVENRY